MIFEKRLIEWVIFGARNYYKIIFERNELNVTSVFYILNKAVFLIKLIIFNITRLSLACLDRDICFYINVFFLCTYFLLT